ncbi:MAG TPA: TIGR00730 family Rossman fold protein [Paludibacter sp.]|nr:TIGR00730 family Rossman fold protein [Paludibacter sp.]
MQTICVYCASSTQVKPAYFEATRKLGKIFAAEGLSVVYGGGAKGLMGQLADSMIESGGTITGVIPRFMCDVEWNHNGLAELILVETMHERKQKMAVMADAVVALPGGCGTLEELLEVITWKRLGIFTKPVVIVNTDGYFNELVGMLNKAVDENFMREEHRAMWAVVHSPEEVLPAIRNAAAWDENARSFAAL